ncbi:MAG: 3-dehydroquinate synthase [archaeon]
MRVRLHKKADSSYDIIVGSRIGIPVQLGNCSSCFIITDSVVKKLYGVQLLAEVQKRNRAHLLSFPAGEKHKTLDTFSGLIDMLHAQGADRRSLIIALGGGVVGDVAGFVASAYMRGIDFIQVPTTLLAMVDSSVGGKVGVDTKDGKNLIGAFHQPKAVLIDTETLATLPETEFRNGMVELVKHAIIRDRDFFKDLESNIDRVLAKERLEDAILASVRIKAWIVEEDEKEAGIRRLVNYGHTFGHAIESLSSYAVPHGAAVAKGMLIAAKLSAELGHLSEAELKRHNRLIEKIQPAWKLGLRPSDLIRSMKHDKKAHHGKLVFVLLDGIGKAFVADSVPEDVLRKVLGEQ